MTSLVTSYDRHRGGGGAAHIQSRCPCPLIDLLHLSSVCVCVCGCKLKTPTTSLVGRLPAGLVSSPRFHLHHRPPPPPPSHLASWVDWIETWAEGSITITNCTDLSEALTHTHTRMSSDRGGEDINCVPTGFDWDDSALCAVLLRQCPRRSEMSVIDSILILFDHFRSSSASASSPAPGRNPPEWCCFALLCFVPTPAKHFRFLKVDHSGHLHSSQLIVFFPLF